MSIAAWALASVLALAPAEEPPSEAVAVTEGAEPAGSARLVFGPEYRGSLTLVDDTGHEAAAVVLRPGGRTIVEVPAGRYSLRDGEGQTISTLEVEADQVRSVTLPDEWQVPEPEAPRSTPARSAAVVVTGPLEDPSSERPQVELVRRRRWARWAAPLLSAVVPGGGQALNGQPGRGLAVFTGTLGLALGTVAVWGARDPTAGTSPDPTGRDGREAVRLGGLAGLGAAAGLLYIGQILDAHAQAADRRATEPRTGHVVALEVARFSTVGFAPGEPGYDLYSDWSLAVMGQLVPRVTLGLSDLGIKYGRHRSRVTVQAGARAAYRFFDRRRVWLAAGGGVLLQGTRADAALEPLAEEPPGPSNEAQRGFSTVPYVHFDARLFLLDRWSLGLMPRVSVPLWARRYRGDRVLPRHATTFELGATMGVYF